jgi:hypothetical protein
MEAYLGERGAFSLRLAHLLDFFLACRSPPTQLLIALRVVLGGLQNLLPSRHLCSQSFFHGLKEPYIEALAIQVHFAFKFDAVRSASDAFWQPVIPLPFVLLCNAFAPSRVADSGVCSETD